MHPRRVVVDAAGARAANREASHLAQHGVPLASVRAAPFGVGLALGVIGLPFFALDMGIISSIPATVGGTIMMAKKSEEKRAKLGVVSPEEADMLKFSRLGK